MENISFIFGQLCVKKTCAFVVMGIGKKGYVGWRWDGQRSLGRQCPFCWCACVCGAESGLRGHIQASDVALAAKY